MVDEEKRIKIQDLRQSGHIIESPRNHEVPFGVRAIQSGIQVDGIWISQQNTPTTSQLKLEAVPGGTSDLQTLSRLKSGNVSTDVRPKSKYRNQPLGERDILRNLDRAIAAQEAADRPGTSGSRSSYKPKRASQLRYGIHGGFEDEMTLQHLEGKSPSKKVQSHRPRASDSRHPEAEAESSAADSELSSGISSHSDISLSNVILSPNETLAQQEQPLSTASVASGKTVESSKNLQSSKAEYFTVPLYSPPYSPTNTSDPFQTPLPSPPSTHVASDATNVQGSASSSSWYDDAQEIPAPPARVHSPFVSGELHINKSVRKVNSGFEVLPAGTFGVPAEFKGKGVDYDYEDESGERRQSKLQKKPRSSISGRRPSANLEH